MVDYLKLNKILPSLSPAPKVKRTGQRKRKDQQNPFEEEFKKMRGKKKKEDDSEHAGIPDRENSIADVQRVLHAGRQGTDREEMSTDSEPSRIIDIRV